MKNRVSLFVVAAGAVMALGGCVSSGTYQAKEQESQQLGKSLEEVKASYAELQAKCGKFAAANSEQSEQLKKFFTELALLKQENEKLAEAARPDNLLKSLAETLATLQQKVEQLKVENAKMKQELLVPQQLQPVALPPRKTPPAETVSPAEPSAVSPPAVPAVKQ